jgi:PleD family two-component response regulator
MEMSRSAITFSNSRATPTRVLVAEDDETSRNGLVRLLQRDGYDVTATNDGQAAIDILLAPNPPHIALLDWGMPRLDGIHVCWAVRSIPSNPYTYIIMVSGRDQSTDALAAFAAGVDDFLSKPLDQLQLLARLRCGERVLGLEKRYAERMADLENAATKMRRLTHLLPICTECKKVRNDSDYWRDIEAHRADQAGAPASQGICPACVTAILQRNTVPA